MKILFISRKGGIYKKKNFVRNIIPLTYYEE